MWLAGLAGTAVTLGLAVGAGDEKPPPYPSVSPVLPAVLPPTPVIPGDEVKPVSGETVKPVSPAPKPVKEVKAVPVPKVPDATVPLPAIPAATPTPNVTPPVIPVPNVAPPSVPAIPIIPPATAPTTTAKPEITLPTVPATPQTVESKPKPPETLSTTITPVAVPTAPPAKTKETAPVATKAEPPAKPKVEKPKEPGTINISIGATPGVLDNTAKFDAMVTDAKSAYAKISDYSCHFIKQERVRGKLTAEVIHELHARTTPFAAYVKTVQPKEAAGFEMIYVSGKFAMNQVRVKPAGGTFTTVPADDSRANSGRHPADQVGIASVIATIEKQIATERKLGHPVTVSIRDFMYAGKSVIRYELLCDKPHAHRYCHRAVVYIDRETKLPVRFEAYDEPRSGGSPEGDLLETYSFVNMRTNVGHPAAIFER